MGCPAKLQNDFIHGPHRLVVRTSRRGRDNPGSNPGVDMRPGSTVREDRLRTVAYQPAVPVRCAAVLMSTGHSPGRSCQYCGLLPCCARLACRCSDVQSPVGARTAALHAQHRIQPLAPAQRGLNCTSSAACTPPWGLAPGCSPKNKQVVGWTPLLARLPVVHIV